MVYEVWILVAFNYPGYTGKICKETVIIQVIFFVFATLLAQVLFVAQIYALSGRNRKVLAVFTFLTAVQLALGIVYIAEPGNTPLALPPIPLDAFQICVLNSSITFNTRVVYTTFSLAYNAASFLTLLRLSYSTCGPRLTWPVVLKTMVKDSALYFIVVFTSHSTGVLFMTLNTTNVRHSSLAVVNAFIPIMVSRLVLNLRRSSDQGTNAQLEWMSRPLSFAPNYELTVRTQTCDQANFPGSSPRGTSFQSDAL